MPTLATNKYCTGCMACMDACHHHAIERKTIYGMSYPYVNTDLCINCKLCEKACPIVTKQRKNEVEDIRVYGGWAKDEKLRYKGASGGAFAGLALSFMKRHQGNVAVYGAALLDNHVQHKRITTIDEMPLLMNSKYVQSETMGIYRDVLNDIKDKRWVCFSGTPCQVAALYAFLDKKRDYERLMTIEVICHGVASQEALDLHLYHFHSPKIISFRNKKEGQGGRTSQCTTIERKGKPYRLKREDDYFYKIYAGWLMDRKSCSNCKYSTIQRIADITLGDFWGGARTQQEYEQGINVIIATNQKGNDFIRESMDLEIYDSTLRKAIDGNPHLYNGFKYIQYHPIVIWPNMARKVLGQSLFFKIVTNRMPWKLLWAFYKVMTILHTKRQRQEIERKYGYFLDRHVQALPS